MIAAMEPMKRCARCGKTRREHEEDGLCPNERGKFNPVIKVWADCQRPLMEKAEEVYDRCPNIQRATGLPVPFEDCMPQTAQRCVEQASVEIWTGRQQDVQP
jgi:hypothetical protein